MRTGLGLTRRLLRGLGPLWRVRSLALLSELLFWAVWLGSVRHREQRDELLDPNRRLLPELDPVLERIAPRRVRVLEVGAGPMSALGRLHPTKEIDLVPTDLLADWYRRLLALRGLDPPVPTVRADAERLRDSFAAESFDLVFAANCLDHMEHPLRAIEEMVAVVRPGGWVVLSHGRDEGERQEYTGLHRWNLREAHGRFFLWRPGEEIDVSERLGPRCAVIARTTVDQVRVEIEKRAES